MYKNTTPSLPREFSTSQDHPSTKEHTAPQPSTKIMHQAETGWGKFYQFLLWIWSLPAFPGQLQDAWMHQASPGMLTAELGNQQHVRDPTVAQI